MDIETINYFLQCWVGFGAFVFLIFCLFFGVPNREGKVFTYRETALVLFSGVWVWPVFVIVAYWNRDAFIL